MSVNADDNFQSGSPEDYAHLSSSNVESDSDVTYCVSELKEQMADGFFISGKHFTVAQVSLICDALAVANIIEKMEHGSFVCCRKFYVAGKRAWLAV